jgi:hypothetical protein
MRCASERRAPRGIKDPLQPSMMALFPISDFISFDVYILLFVFRVL